MMNATHFLRNVKDKIPFEMAIPALRMFSTLATPEVCFNAATGVLYIAGRSMMDNPMAFYQPLINWIDRYTPTPNNKTVVTINLEHIKANSVFLVNYLFMKLQILIKKGFDVTITWQYKHDDKSMKEIGDDCATKVNIPFKLLKVDGIL